MTFALQLVSGCLPASYKELLMAYFVAAGVGGRMQGTVELLLSNQAYIIICQMAKCTQ